jgi:fructose-bisphosphate aldolase, class II
MLSTLKEILTDARARHYAVPAFDCVEDVFIRAICETAEAWRAPAVLMCLEPDMRGNGWYYSAGLARAAAAHHKIPVALHLDHATDLETIKLAIELGFTSVMIDGSSLPFEENVRITKATVELAHPRGISVEAELGKVGGMDLDDTACADSVLTEPEEVSRFCELTHVDALAVSIGTSHGVYRSLPTLHIERLKQLNAVSPVPLVLHGGSGTPDDQIRNAVRHGVCKLNIYADCRIAMGRGVTRTAQALRRPDPLPADVFGPIREEISAVVAQKLELLGACNRV